MSEDGVCNPRHTLHGEGYIFVSAYDLGIFRIEGREVNRPIQVVILARGGKQREFQERENLRPGAGASNDEQNDASNRSIRDCESPIPVRERGQDAALDASS